MKKNAKGQIILTHCEICAGIGIKRKLTKEEQESYGHECQECVDHLRDMFKRASDRVDGGESVDGIIWTKQKGTGLVMVLDDHQKALKELGQAGCADVTARVKDQLMVAFEACDIDPGSVDHFDWEDHKGKTFWHVVDPGE